MKKERKIKIINTHGVKGYSVDILNKAATRETHARQVKTDNARKGK